MPITARDAAGSARDRLRSQPWGLAIAVIANDDQEIVLDFGEDEFDEESYFQVGSITKTMTGLLVADAVGRGETSLQATVGSILGDSAGTCTHLTLLDLVTQHSGLPRLPPNLDPRQVDPKDPYAAYSENDLLQALRLIDPPSPKYGYSNFGFMLLGLLLDRITGVSYAELVRERVLLPLGMELALCGQPPEEQRVPGYEGFSHTPWWTNQLPGAEGIACGIRELASYARSHLFPPALMRPSIEMALAQHAAGPPVMGLGWLHQGGGHWHNGGTGGFRSFIAIHRETNSGIALLANSHDAESLDRVGFAVLTELVRSKSAR